VYIYYFDYLFSLVIFHDAEVIAYLAPHAD